MLLFLLPQARNNTASGVGVPGLLAPKRMPDLFIPPEGALQFHVTRRISGVPVDFAIWVWPPRKRGTAWCSCTRNYEVIVGSLGTQAVLAGAHRDAPRHVCDCMGRLIE